MDNPLHPAELRVLGTLIEKEITTPEYYPMTLNSLVAACNQKTNRWPVSEYTEDEVIVGIEGLKLRGYAASITGSGRVTKFAQRFTEKLNLGRRETAVLCVLLLRGQQTIGEIKGRTERMYAFSDLDETEMVLHKMMEREEGPLVQKLPHAPGTKEPRYAQTLGGAIDVQAFVQPAAQSSGSSISDRLSILEADLARLREEVSDLRQRLDSVLN
jgi:uncharacterized protein YceH (UPF0502 family)